MTKRIISIMIAAIIAITGLVLYFPQSEAELVKKADISGACIFSYEYGELGAIQIYYNESDSLLTFVRINQSSIPLAGVFHKRQIQSIYSYSLAEQKLMRAESADDLRTDIYENEIESIPFALTEGIYFNPGGEIKPRYLKMGTTYEAINDTNALFCKEIDGFYIFFLVDDENRGYGDVFS